MENGPGILLTIIAFIGGFSALVFIHEWGHYIVARIFGVKIDSFSIGFGRELIGRTDRNGVRWKVCILPLGGYVKFFGDASGTSNADVNVEDITDEDKETCFHFKPVWQRFLIVAAGPAINLLAAALIFAGFNMTYGINVVPSKVGGFTENAPAEQAGLIVGDVIISINGDKIERMSEVSAITRLYPDQTLRFGIDRSGQIEYFDVKLGVNYLEDRFGNQYPLGFMGIYSDGGQRVELSAIASLTEGMKQTRSVIDTIFTTVGQMIVGTRSTSELGGPLRIATMTGEAADRGLANLILFLAFISINLGIVNLLPIPVLDGGHLLFYIVEAVKGSPLNKKAQEMGFIGGMALLLIFMVFVTMNDLQSIVL